MRGKGRGGWREKGAFLELERRGEAVVSSELD